MTPDLIISIFLIVVFCANSIIATLFLIKTRGTLQVLVAGFSYASAFWALGVSLFRTIPINSQWILPANQLIDASGALIAPFFLHFSFEFSRKKLSLFWMSVMYLTAFFFIGLVFLPNAIIAGIDLEVWGKSSHLGYGYWYYTAYFTIYYCIGFAILWRAYNKAVGSHRTQIRYILVASFITCTIDMIFNVICVQLVNYKYLWVGPLSGLFWVSIIAYAVTKHELMDIKAIVTKSMAFIIASILFSFTYLFFVWLFFTQLGYFSISWQFLGFTVIFGGFGVGLYFHRVQRFIQTSAYRKFLKINYDFDSVLKHTSKQFSKAVQQSDVLDQLLDLQDSLEVNNSLAIIRTPDGFDCYELSLSDGQETTKRVKKTLPIEIAEEITLAVSQFEAPVLFSKDLPDLVQTRLAETYPISDKSVCLIVKPYNRVEAIFIIGAKLSEDDYNRQDLSLFEVIVNQAVLVFERIEKLNQLAESAAKMEVLNSELETLNQQLEKRVVEEVAVRNRAVSTAQNLALKASMSNLTAGISHEIRNPMTSIKSNAQNLYSRLIGEVGEDPNPWKPAVSVEKFMEIVAGDAVKAETILAYLTEYGFVSQTGEITDAANPFYDPIELPNLPDVIAPFKAAIVTKIGELFKASQVLVYLSLISRESERVVAITNTMLEYGVSRGVSQDSFVNLNGFNAEKSARLWQEMVDRKYLDTFGGILVTTTTANGGRVHLDLSPEFEANTAEIVTLLESFPVAKKSLFDPGVPLSQLMELKRNDLSKQSVIATLNVGHTGQIMGDPNRLFQVFNILISNAIESMEKDPKPKQLTITTSTQESPDGQPKIIFSFKDSGCGMDEQTLAHIRDPFFTTKGGTGGKNVGLGVSILFDIVESHEGKIEIDSQPNEGTTFTLIFPCVG